MNNDNKESRKNDILKILKGLKEYVLNNTTLNSDTNFFQDISKIEDYISQQNRGLNFEEYIEEINCDSVISKFKLIEKKELAINKGGNENYLIEAENLIALFMLRDKYLNKIDIVIVDPPYNTGNLKLKYNDSDYVDPVDEYSHSKWLSFMNHRLKAAYRLLTSNGVMYINIDETQIGCLILLCEQIFGESNVTVMVWPKTNPRYDQNRVEKPIINVKITHEYVILCYKDKTKTQFNKIIKLPNNADGFDPEEPMWMETILSEMGTTSSAKDELYEIFGSREAFATPKPRKLIKELIRAASGKDAMVLDIFAGSGTTGHAIMDLNKEDKGNRTYILITNNENNICRDITYERLKRAIERDYYNENLIYLFLEPL